MSMGVSIIKDHRMFLLFTNYTKRVIYLANINNPHDKSHIKLMQNKGIQCR